MGHGGSRRAAAGLSLYKPHLQLGILAMWLMEGSWGRRAWLGFLRSGAGLIGLSLAWLPEATPGYLRFVGTVYPDLPGWPRLDDALAALRALAGTITTFRFWPRHQEPELRFATAIVLTLRLTPQVIIYHWAIPLIPAWILWKALPSRRGALQAVYAAIWIAMFLSVPLILAARSALGVALMPMLPDLGWGTWRIRGILRPWELGEEKEL